MKKLIFFVEGVGNILQINTIVYTHTFTNENKKKQVDEYMWKNKNGLSMGM